MRTATCRITVYFDDPFWAMLYEREGEGWYAASRTVFGAEPKDCEVYAFLLQNWRWLRFSPPVQAGERTQRPDNPKRRQRAARRAVEQAGMAPKRSRRLPPSASRASRRAASARGKKRNARPKNGTKSTGRSAGKSTRGTEQCPLCFGIMGCRYGCH